MKTTLIVIENDADHLQAKALVGKLKAGAIIRENLDASQNTS
jgi:hypothetical protein